MADPMAEAILTARSAMDAIAEIVRKTYGDPESMAMQLEVYARTSTPAHSIAWVVKKAHDAMAGIEWQRQHVALNRAVGLPDDFVG